MKKQFKSGDRVAVYGVILHTGDTIGGVNTRTECTVDNSHGDYLELTRDGKYVGVCNPRQCVRLVAPSERRSVYINLYTNGLNAVAYETLSDALAAKDGVYARGCIRTIHFREVPKKKSKAA